MNLSSASPHVHYSRLVEPYFEELSKYDFKNIQLHNGANLGEEISKFLIEIDKINEDNLMSFKNDDLSVLVKYFQSAIPNKTFSQMIYFWPPILPIHVKNTPIVLKFIAKMCTLVKNPEVFIFWLITEFFSINWSPNGSITSKFLKAFASCRIPGNQNDFWAFIDQNDVFKIEFFNKYSEKYEEYKSFEAFSVLLTQTGVMVENKDHSEQIIFDMELKQQQDLWRNIGWKKEVYFTSFLNHMKKPYPTQVLIAFLNVLTSNDWYFIRAFLSDCVFPLTNENMNKLQDIFNIFAYCGKVPVLISSLFTKLIQDTHILSQRKIFRRNSHLKKVFKIITNNYCEKYIEYVLSKVANYIELKEVIINDNVEIIIFTCVKVIIESFNYVPKQVRLVASIIRTFTKVRFNNRNIILKFLSEYFFGNVIIPLLKKLLKTNEKLYSSVSNTIINILKDIFSFSTFDGELSLLNNRLIKHTFPRMERFLFGLGDILYPPSFEQPTKIKFESSLIQLLDFINERSELMEQAFEREMKESRYQPTSAGWFFGAILTQMFHQESDENLLREHSTWSFPRDQLVNQNLQQSSEEKLNSKSSYSFTISDFERQFTNGSSEGEEEEKSSQLKSTQSESLDPFEGRLIGSCSSSLKSQSIKTKISNSSSKSYSDSQSKSKTYSEPECNNKSHFEIKSDSASSSNSEPKESKKGKSNSQLKQKQNKNGDEEIISNFLVKSEENENMIMKIPPPLEGDIESPPASIDGAESGDNFGFFSNDNGGFEIEHEEESMKEKAPPLSDTKVPSEKESVNKDFSEFAPLAAAPSLPVQSSSPVGLQEFGIALCSSSWESYGSITEVNSDTSSAPPPNIVVTTSKEEFAARERAVKESGGSADNDRGPALVLVVDDDESVRPRKRPQKKSSRTKVAKQSPDEDPPSLRTLKRKSPGRSPLAGRGDSSSPFDSIAGISDQELSGVISDVRPGGDIPKTEKKKKKRASSKRSTPKRRSKKKVQRTAKRPNSFVAANSNEVQ